MEPEAAQYRLNKRIFPHQPPRSGIRRTSHAAGKPDAAA